MKSTEFESRDIFIHFRDMILYVLLRVRSILLVALAVAVLAAGVKYWQDSNRYNSIEKAPQSEPVSKPLDADGLAHVALVQRYQWDYENLCTYNTTAPMMKIDFVATPTRQMSYLITGSRSFVAATLCREILSDSMLYDDLAETLSTEETVMEPAYLAELVTVELEQDTAENGDSVFVQVRVIAPTEELCGSLATVVRDAMSNAATGVKDEMGNCQSRWMFDRYGVVRSDVVREWQMERLSAQEQARTELKKATDALTAAEEDFLFVTDREEEPTLTYPAPSLSIAFLLLGFFGGAFAMAAFYAVRYLCCGRVLSGAEVQVRHGLPAFGALPGSEKQKQFFLHRWLRNRLQDKESDPFLLWNRMALVAKNAGVKSVYLVGDAQRLSGLDEAMAQAGVTLEIGSSPLANGDTMAALARSEALILTADLEVTRHDTMAQELELARELGCQTLGVLLMKK